MLNVRTAALVVFDEADRLLCEGGGGGGGGDALRTFEEDIEVLLRAVPPAGARQTLAFSATFPQSLVAMLTSSPGALMHAPERVLLDGGGGASLRRVRQLYVLRTSFDGDGVEWVHASLVDVLARTPFHQAVVFAQNPTAAAAAADHLSSHGFPSSLLTAQMSQARRTTAMDAARAFDVRCLVCTDVGARGLDLPRVTLVVHLGLPSNALRAPSAAAATYAHRVGRAGRFGARGASVALLRGGRAELDQLRRMLATSLEDVDGDADALLSAFPTSGALSSDAVTSTRHNAPAEVEARQGLVDRADDAVARHRSALDVADREGLVTLEEWAASVAQAVEDEGAEEVEGRLFGFRRRRQDGGREEEDSEEEDSEEEEDGPSTMEATPARSLPPPPPPPHMDDWHGWMAQYAQWHSQYSAWHRAYTAWWWCEASTE